jgi:uncharacterized protein YdcH (DUF465 family)
LPEKIKEHKQNKIKHKKLLDEHEMINEQIKQHQSSIEKIQQFTTELTTKILVDLEKNAQIKV